MSQISRLAWVLAAAALVASAQTQSSPPGSGPVEILPLEQVLPGMEVTAWTTFRGTEAEPVPMEILGRLKNAWGPSQDIILAKMGGKALRTNVAGGMSGSPVYYDGKLIGAIALRFSTFSPDAIAGITPIEYMLEIDEQDASRPVAASASDQAVASLDLADDVWSRRGAVQPVSSGAEWTPIETPLSFSGAHEGVLDAFAGYFRTQGYQVMQAGASAGRDLGVADSAGALKPGEPIGVVLMSGDMSATALGTVTYNDGRRVLGFGHAMFNSGPIEAPVATGDVLLVLASQLNPVKIANAGSIVGALRQDRHSGIMGVLGETAELIPVGVKVRAFNGGDQPISEKEYRYNIFQSQKLTAQLLMMALYNSMFGVNDFAEESTFRLAAKLNFSQNQELEVESMQTVSSNPMPAPLLLAASVAQQVQRVYLNTRDTPKIEGVDVTIDLLPERRTAVLEGIWVDRRRARAGDEVKGKAIVQPYRGERYEKNFSIRIPAGAPSGRMMLTVRDADSVNQIRQMAALRDGSMTLPQTVSLLNQQLGNNQLQVALLDRAPTAHLGQNSLPNLPLSSLSVMRPAVQGRLALEMQSPLAETSVALDSIVSGSQTLTIEIE